VESIDQLSVKEELDYEGARADKTYVLEHSYDVQRFRVYWLKNKRDEWEWVEANSDEPNPYVIIKNKT